MRSFLASVCVCSCVASPVFASCFDTQMMFGWITRDDNIVLRFPGTPPYGKRSLGVRSRGGYLIPIGDGTTSADASPFVFMLSNDEHGIYYAAIPGSAVGFEDRELTLSARYDLDRAIADGVNLVDDLYFRECNYVVYSAYPGDANFDLTVDFDDFLTLSQNFGSTDAIWPEGDFNWDRQVDFDDYLALALNFGAGAEVFWHLPEWRPSLVAASVESVPEPDSAIGLLLLLTFGVWSRQRRRRS